MSNVNCMCRMRYLNPNLPGAVDYAYTGFMFKGDSIISHKGPRFVAGPSTCRQQEKKSTSKIF